MKRLAVLVPLALSGCYERSRAIEADQYSDEAVEEAVAEIMCSGVSNEDKAHAIALLVEHGEGNGPDEDRSQDVYDIASNYAERGCRKVSQ